MIQADRELLARLRAVNQHMGEVVLRLLDRWQDTAELDADDLREVGHGLGSLVDQLADMGVAMVRRADEIAGIAHPPSTERESTQQQRRKSVYSGNEISMGAEVVVGSQCPITCRVVLDQAQFQFGDGGRSLSVVVNETELVRLADLTAGALRAVRGGEVETEVCALPDVDAPAVD